MTSAYAAFRLIPVLAVLICCLAISLGQLHAEEGSRPNLIVIMADDLGYVDVGFNGCQDIPTPHIDRIAAGGVRCSNGYATYAVCGPSRAGFITGRYQSRFGFDRNPLYRVNDPTCGLPRSERTLATALKDCGYSSGIVGKWHLGTHAPSHHPLKRGFDYFFGHLGGGHQYMPEHLTIKRSEDATNEGMSYRTWILQNTEPVKTTKYLTDEFSDAAVKFIEGKHKKPFFLFLAYNAPHGPLQATDKYLKRFPKLSGKRKIYAAMVSALDDGVGRVLDSLEKYKISDNTIVVFLSDNGGVKNNACDNGPLRGWKSSCYEGGFRVPFAVRWPGQLPAGKTCDTPISSLDIFATMVSLAGIKTKGYPQLDGLNMLSVLKGESAAPVRPIYLRKLDQKMSLIRLAEHKMIVKAGANPELYNLNKDVSEQTDIASGHPDLIKDLQQQLTTWHAEQATEAAFPGLRFPKKSH